jgi:alpha-2-macroglobulin-like protein
VLALKALVEFARQNKQPLESAGISFRVSDRVLAEIGFNNNAAEPLVFEIPNAENQLVPGDNRFTISTNAQQSYAMSVSWSCRTLQPRNSPECPVSLEAKLAKETIREGDSVRLDLTLKNLQAKDQGMAVAVIGLPAGLKLPEDREELKQLMSVPRDGGEPALSYWEQNGRELVLYWRGLTENQTVKLSLNLIGEIPGEYRGPASRAYLYYGSEFKHWIAPLKITIEK